MISFKNDRGVLDEFCPPFAHKNWTELVFPADFTDAFLAADTFQNHFGLEGWAECPVCSHGCNPA